ncbi:MAG TPA: HEAT repeat domain-containing protein [Planctomycetota bacterium]|nr:HEAT repeat domain-containing protein [Planctomycetota bacterium]
MRLFCVLLLLAASLTVAGEAEAQANYDDVIGELIMQLDKDPGSARDAAQKLANFGKRAVPPLIEMLQANFKKEKGKQQIVYTTVWALSRIKNGDAAKALIPVLEDEKTPPELRSLIVEASGMEFSEEGIAALQKLAAGDADLALRKKAYSQLSMMPTAWAKSEKLFVEALSSPETEIRTIAAKQCYFCRIYLTATDKLIELAETDTEEAVRIQSLLALGRMRVRMAVPALTRLVTAEETDEKIRTQALKALVAITTIPLKDRAATQNWWDKFGKNEYGKLEELKKEADALKAKQKALEAENSKQGGVSESAIRKQDMPPAVPPNGEPAR